jgi:hypothetical protein
MRGWIVGSLDFLELGYNIRGRDATRHAHVYREKLRSTTTRFADQCHGNQFALSNDLGDMIGSLINFCNLIIIQELARGL